MKIDIKAMVGPRCLTQEDGKLLYDKIHPFLLRGESVELDFIGVRQFACSFFNVSIGELLKDINLEAIRTLVIFSNIRPVGKEIVHRVLQNAFIYYGRRSHG